MVLNLQLDVRYIQRYKFILSSTNPIFRTHKCPAKGRNKTIEFDNL